MSYYGSFVLQCYVLRMRIMRSTVGGNLTNRPPALRHIHVRNSLSMQGIEPTFPSCRAHSQSTIVTELYRFRTYYLFLFSFVCQFRMKGEVKANDAYRTKRFWHYLGWEIQLWHLSKQKVKWAINDRQWLNNKPKYVTLDKRSHSLRNGRGWRSFTLLFTIKYKPPLVWFFSMLDLE